MEDKQLQSRDKEVAVLTEVAMQREIAEVQAAMTIAKKFPRDHLQAIDRITIVCQRPALADGALYTYARGGTDITGPSIRLAEAIAQQWGNLQFGIRELEQRIGESTVEAYAWDLETNVRESKVFQVKHTRHTKGGSYLLKDPRDIYEMVANQGARRLRACILGVIPGDVTEAAVTQCEVTLKAQADTSPEALQKMAAVFAAIGVTQEMLEQRIQRKLESIVPAQVIALRKIFNSIKDGMSKPADWFETEPPPAAETAPPKATGAKKKAAATQPPTQAPEVSAAAGTQAQDPGNGGGQEPTSQAITLPELMELAKKPDGMVDLPIPLMTTKGVPIGRWLDWGPDLGGEMSITLELVDNLPEMAGGLTHLMIEKSFNEAGIRLKIATAADEVQEGKERLTLADDPKAPVSQETLANAEKVFHAPPKGNGGQGEKRKSLF